MQKKVIALAVAGLVSGAAFAQSNVTIYGVADVGVANINSGAGGHTQINSGQNAGSRLGFKGEEALGNGLKAVFLMEAGLLFDTGSAAGTAQTYGNSSTATLARQMYAGIESAALGAVTIGRQYSPMYDVLVKTDTFGLGSGATYFNAVGTIAGYTTRLNNSVRYETPTFAGFTGTLTYATAEDNLNVSSGKGGQFWGVKGQYENGPVYVGAAYHDGNQTTTQIATGDLKYSQAYTLGASYDFKVVKAYANFANGKTQNKELSVDMLDRAYHVGATVPFGGVQAVSLGYSKRDVRTLDLTSANDFYSVGARYTYDLSKRTKFYTAYTKGVNKGLATFSLSGAADNAGQITQAGYDPRRIELGVQHSF